MKIAILNQPQDPAVAAEEQRGSVAIVNWELAQRLARRHEVTIYAPRGVGQPPTERWNGIDIRRTNFSARYVHKALQLVAGRMGNRLPYAYSPLYHREYYSQVAAGLRTQPVDVVHLPVQMQFADYFKKTLPGAKLVLHMHQDELAQLDPGFLGEQLARVDSVVTVSEFVSARGRARFPQFAAKIHTIGNGVDVERFHPPPPQVAPARASKLLFVGRIAPDKGLHLLVRAFNTLVQERPDIELTLIGKPGLMPLDVLGDLLKDDPALESLREFYGRSTLEWLQKEILGQRQSYVAHLRSLLSPQAAQRVHFRGSVSLAELVRVYGETDLFLLPSIWQESYGLPVAEAMACGVPVLASNSGGVPELVEDGVTGVLVPRLDAKALLDAMRILLATPEKLRAMGQASRVRAERLLSWELSAQRLEHVYARPLG